MAVELHILGSYPEWTDAVRTGIAEAVGLAGDGGNDLVVNQGALEVLAVSKSYASSTSISV